MQSTLTLEYSLAAFSIVSEATNGVVTISDLRSFESLFALSLTKNAHPVIDKKKVTYGSQCIARVSATQRGF